MHQASNQFCSAPRGSVLLFNPGAVYQEIVSDPSGWGLSPTGLPDTGRKSGLPDLLINRLQIGIPMTPSLGSVICYSGSQNPGKHILPVYYKGHYKRYR